MATQNTTPTVETPAAPKKWTHKWWRKLGIIDVEARKLTHPRECWAFTHPETGNSVIVLPSAVFDSFEDAARDLTAKLVLAEERSVATREKAQSNLMDFLTRYQEEITQLGIQVSFPKKD